MECPPSHGEQRGSKKLYFHSREKALLAHPSLSLTHAWDEQSRASVSIYPHTHTQTDDRQYGVTQRQTVPPTDIRLPERTGGWVCHPSSRLHHFLQGSSSIPSWEQPETKKRPWRETRDFWPSLKRKRGQPASSRTLLFFLGSRYSTSLQTWTPG